MREAPLIREADATDLPELLALYHELNPADPAIDLPTAEAALATIPRFPGSVVLMALVNAIPAGSLTLFILPNMTRGGRPFALIENVVTSERFRRRGIGKTLMAEALDRAWALDCYKVMLLTGSKNPATLAFYRQCGFVDDKTGFQIRNGVPADYRLPA